MIELSLTRQVVVQIEFLRLEDIVCDHARVRLYKSRIVSERELLKDYCGEVMMVYGEQHTADWNTATLIWYRHPLGLVNRLIATYTGMPIVSTIQDRDGTYENCSYGFPNIYPSRTPQPNANKLITPTLPMKTKRFEVKKYNYGRNELMADFSSPIISPPCIDNSSVHLFTPYTTLRHATRICFAIRSYTTIVLLITTVAGHILHTSAIECTNLSVSYVSEKQKSADETGDLHASHNTAKYIRIMRLRRCSLLFTYVSVSCGVVECFIRRQDSKRIN